MELVPTRRSPDRKRSVDLAILPLRLSGPLLDGIDLQVYVRPVPLAELRAAEPGESSGDETRGQFRSARTEVDGSTMITIRPGFGHARPALGHSALQLREIASLSAGQDLDSETGMPPRPVLPRQFYLITRRCTQRQLLLRPDRETNNAFTYCLIVAALRYGIEVLLPCAMSNHHHTVIYDRDGRYPEFVEHFHKAPGADGGCTRRRARCLVTIRLALTLHDPP